MEPGPSENPLPEALLRRVRKYSGRLSTEAVSSMEEQLPFFGALEASQRAGVQLVVQTAVVNFIDWLHDPGGDILSTVEAFRVVPQDLARRVTLRQTVDMVRVAMEFFEKWLPLLARNDQQLVALTEAVLRYGREIGFAAAAVYASAAESRGAWDTRLEAMVVDAVVRGDSDSAMLSRAATLNWDSTAKATVLVGSPPPADNVSSAGTVHDVAERHGRSALAVVQGSRLVAIVSGEIASPSTFVEELLAGFSDGPVVIGDTAESLADAHTSARQALIGFQAVAGWRTAPRPVHACELLPERVIIGDHAAAVALDAEIIAPLRAAGSALTETLDIYLDCGGSIEHCARELFVHPNTVRYRLRKVAAATGRDPADARDAYVLRMASTIGRLLQSGARRVSESPGNSETSHVTGVTPWGLS